jgi:uncharacterized protein (DUF302 family)
MNSSGASYALTTKVSTPFAETVEKVRAALATQGFGVVSEIDIQATLKKKIDVDVPAQLILGACNPNYAHQAMQAEPSISVLLPCNVVVRDAGDGSGTIVQMIDPQTMVDVTANPDMHAVANEVGKMLNAALAEIKAAA